MNQNPNRLDATRARQLLSAAGKVGVPVRTWQDKGSWHAGRALLLSVSESSNTAIIKPLQGHKKTEEVPISSLSTWKAGQAAQAALHKKEPMSPSPTAKSNDGKFVVFDSERGLLYSAGVEGTKTRKGFTKKVEEARLFDDLPNAKRCAGHLANNKGWAAVLGEDFRLEVSTLEEYRTKRPYPFNEPPNPNIHHKPHIEPQKVQSDVGSFLAATEVKPIIHDSGTRQPAPEPQRIPSEPHPAMLAEMMQQTAGGDFKVTEADFRELQSAYRDLEEAIALTQEARQRVMGALSRICGKMNVGLSAAGLTNSPS